MLCVWSLVIHSCSHQWHTPFHGWRIVMRFATTYLPSCLFIGIYVVLIILLLCIMQRPFLGSQTRLGARFHCYSAFTWKWICWVCDSCMSGDFRNCWISFQRASSPDNSHQQSVRFWLLHVSRNTCLTCIFNSGVSHTQDQDGKGQASGIQQIKIQNLALYFLGFL